jgi:glutamine amidotransferase
MCRLYGFHSNIPTRLSCSLIKSQNSLVQQSRLDSRGQSNADGWGIAYLSHNGWQVRRHAAPAFKDPLFSEEVRHITSTLVIAHVRAATVGQVSEINTQPFHHKKWVLAHNGTVADFAQHRQKFLDRIAPDLVPFIEGETDSEHIFYLLLTLLSEAYNPWEEIEESPLPLVEALIEVARYIDAWTGNFRSSLNMLISNGSTVAAYRQGMTLFHVRRCCISDCEMCGQSHVPETKTDYYSWVVASEPLTQEGWQEIQEGHAVGVGIQNEIVERTR